MTVATNHSHHTGPSWGIYANNTNMADTAKELAQAAVTDHFGQALRTIVKFSNLPVLMFYVPVILMKNPLHMQIGHWRQYVHGKYRGG